MDSIINSKIANLEAGVELVNKVLADLTEDLKAITSDKRIPVLERWHIWCGAPDSLKKHESWYMDIYYKDTNLLEKRECNRHETVDVSDLVNDFIECEWSDLTYDKNGNFDEKMPKGWLPDGFEKVLEDLMSKNVGSFRYDW